MTPGMKNELILQRRCLYENEPESEATREPSSVRIFPCRELKVLGINVGIT